MVRGGSAGSQSPAGTLNSVAAGLLTVTTPAEPVSGQPLTRPTGSLWGFGVGQNVNEFPSAQFTAIIQNRGPHVNDYLDLQSPSVNSGNPVTNPWYLNDSSSAPGTIIGAGGAPVTVHVPSVGGSTWNTLFFVGSPTQTPMPVTTSWNLRLRNGSNGAIVASVPVKVDVLKRSFGYFGYYSHYLGTPPVPIDLTPYVLSGSIGGVLAPVVQGTTVQFRTQLGGFAGFSPAATNSVTLQYQIDGVDVGSPVVGPPVLGVGYNYAITVDSTTLTDGTHALSVRCLDYTGGDFPPYVFRCYPQPIIVYNNTGSYTLAQFYAVVRMIPTYSESSGPNNRMNSSAIDYLQFPGTNALPLHNTAGPIPSPQSGFIPPAYDPTSPFYGNAIALRNSSNFYNENLPGAICTEYTGMMRWFDNTLGAVFTYQSYPEVGQNLTSDQVEQNGIQCFDGARNDCLTSQICQCTEGYDTSGNPAFWLVAESTGRIFRQDYDGSVVTLAGLRLNRTLLPYPTPDMALGAISDSQYDSRMEFVGTIDPLGTTVTPSFGDLKGCHDVKYDPRDATNNTVFVANVLNHCIVKITALLSGNPHMVRYAGQDRSLGQTSNAGNVYTGDFQDGVATEFIAGSTVATFTGTVSGNVLRISSGTYTGSTNLKGCPLSWSGNLNTDTGHMITTNISGSGPNSQWHTNFASSGGSQSMTASTQVALFNQAYSLEISAGPPYDVDPVGTMYICDFNNFRLRKIDPSGSNVTTLFGNQDNVVSGFGWSPNSVGPFNINALLTWSGGLLTVSTATPVVITRGQGQAGSFTTPHSIAPYWSVQLQGTGNGNLDNRLFMVSPTGFSSHQLFNLVVASNPGALGSTGTVTVFLPDAFVPTIPTYRPWNVGLTTEAYFPWIQRLTWSSPNPNAGTTISGGSTYRHLVASGPWSEAVLDVDIANQQIRTIGCLAGGPHNRCANQYNGKTTIDETTSSFFGTDCDGAVPGASSGACGPLNDILITQPSASLENWCWRLSWTGDEGSMSWGVQNVYQHAPLRFGINVGGGHYPWSCAFGRKSGRVITNGTSDVGNFQWRILNTAYDVVGGLPPDWTAGPGSWHFDQGAATRGMSIFCQGSIQQWLYCTTPGFFPWGCRPSMWATHGSVQLHHLGLNTYSGGQAVGNNTDSFDGISVNITDDTKLATFIQAGFGGSVPRPELTGDDLQDFIYFIRRSSLTGCLVANAAAFPKRADYAADVTAPVISNNHASRASSTRVTVTWDTDKLTFGLAAAGFASGQGTNFPFHIWQLEATQAGPAANSYKTTGHSVTITGLKPSVTTFVVVMAKDLAGNNAWSSVMTV
jgi:hypothetical protein